MRVTFTKTCCADDRARGRHVGAVGPAPGRPRLSNRRGHGAESFTLLEVAGTLHGEVRMFNFIIYWTKV